MVSSKVERAITAAMAATASAGLSAGDVVVLHESNKVTLRMLPCDVAARVAPVDPDALRVARLEVQLAQRLAASGYPAAVPQPPARPSVHAHGGFVVTLWTYYPPVAAPEIAPADYAEALARLHAGMREVDLPVPHFTDRVEQAHQLLASRADTPALGDADRRLLSQTLRDLSRAIKERGRAEQMLHGEPHPGNLLATTSGPLFIDFETCCRGPVEFDLAHAPEEVADHYPGIDRDLLRDCRILMLAMITTWRWDREDRLPDGLRLGEEWLDRLRAVLDRPSRPA